MCPAGQASSRQTWHLKANIPLCTEEQGWLGGWGVVLPCGGAQCTGTEGGPSSPRAPPPPRCQMMQVIEEYMEDYNQISTAKLRLVLFMDAVSHVCRISRTLRQALGNALLLGVGGSGRRSLTRLASHM